MSSEDIRAEHPQVEHIAFSPSKLTLYFATRVIKAHGTIAPGWKGGGWCSREPSQLTHRLTCTSYSTPSSPWLRLETTGGIAQKPGVSLLLVSKETFFSTQEALRCHSLTGRMPSSASFSSPGSMMVPTSYWSEDSLPKHWLDHTTVVPHSQAHFTR